MSSPMRRTEELQEWICQLTGQRHEDHEHLSVALQDGQLLCLLANAIDPDANLKVNKLNTVFHAKANMRVFTEWCLAMGLRDTDVFQPDDLLDGNNFDAVNRTLSLLFDKFGTIGYSGPYETDENPLSDSDTSSGSSNNVSPVKKGGNNKLTSFMKGGFFKKKASNNSKPEGTPPMSPASPPPMSPQAFKPAATPPRKNTAGNKLNAFLTQVPPSREAPLEHVQRPAGPAKTKSTVARNPMANRAAEASPVSPQTPPREWKKDSAPPGPPSDARNKFAAFLRTNPPAADDEPAAAHPAPARKMSDKFAQRKAVFSPKASPQPVSAFSSQAKTPSVTKTVTPAPKSEPTNKLASFMSKQPPASGGATKARADSSQNKLAAFLATTNIAPSINPGNTTKSAPSSVNKPAPQAAPTSGLASFKAGGQQKTQPKVVAPAAPVTPAVIQQGDRPSRMPFTPRRIAERSTGRCQYVRKRQTYFVPRNRRQSKFSLEEKRKKFMNEQLLLKEEQLRRQAAGDASKQNLIVPGVQCYVPDKEEVWMLAEIMDYNERTKEVTIQAFLDGNESEKRVVDLKDPDTIRAVAGPTAKEIESLPVAIIQDNPGGVEDMRLLRYLNEPSILFNLKQRFEASKPYTYTNDIVIAVNPYKWIENLYGDNLHEQYLRKPRDSLSPHVYSTSTAAYKHMTKNRMNQSILVSGESGAGKTETTKIVMNHLATVAGGRKDKTIAKVIDVNPLLESFGNAKTTRNDNSSRFGKFTQLQFNARGKLIGAKCETYLLEKSRVVSITEGERNYHIFYQILAGLSSREHSEFALDASFAYKYTGALKDMGIPGMDDSQWLEGTRKSLSLIGLDASAQKVLFQVLAGILHLGEVEFAESGESGSRISSAKSLSNVAKMFGVPDSSIEQALCNRTVITRNDSVTVPLDPVEATENRDALAKTVYSKMFDWMVEKINAAICSPESDIDGQIGVLDIFGFEDFAQNGFDQFCINYANEKLQQKFTTDVFKTVEDEYVREGLQWDHIQYQDNKDIVEVIDGKLGIIALMNDHLRQPRGTEEALVNKFRTNHQKKGTELNPHIDFPKVKRTQFVINHYAGSVTYETVGFMEKHRDTLQKDLLDLIQSSSIDMLPELFIENDSVLDSNGARSKTAVRSLGSQFKASLSQLMENISTTNSHYVRCIKPNSNKSSTEFNRRMVVEQLRSAGVIEAIRITRSGYPSRLTPDELATRYCIMFPPSMHSTETRRTCSVFMTAIGRKAPLEYQMGKTLIYFKNGVMEELEAMKSDFMYYEATCIQKVALGFVERRRLARKIKAAIVLQSYSRMALERKEFHFQRRAILKIQRGWRKYYYAPPPHVDVPQPEYEEEEDDGGQWVDEEDELDDSDDDDEGFGDDPASSMHRLNSMRGGRSGRFPSDASLRRMSDLTMKAKGYMKTRSGSGSTTNSSSGLLEEENSMLKIENRNLKFDLELMREQCIELQSIILEINKSRKR